MGKTSQTGLRKFDKKRRWRIIAVDSCDEHFCKINDIVTFAYFGVWPDFPMMVMPNGRIHCIKTTDLVEIDKIGNVIRTYKEGDTLISGTIIQ